MTKQVAIVNLSNWDGEDYIVRSGNSNYHLRPGEHCFVVWGGDLDVSLVDAERKSPPTEPFRVGAESEEGRSRDQTFPMMSISWQSSRGKLPRQWSTEQEKLPPSPDTTD